MGSFSRNYLLASLLVLLFAVPHARPQSTASIHGTVTERSGALLPGALVVDRNTATAESRTVHSDKLGNYLFWDQNDQAPAQFRSIIRRHDP